MCHGPLSAAVVDLEVDVEEVVAPCELVEVLRLGSSESVEGLVGVADGEDGHTGQVVRGEHELVEHFEAGLQQVLLTRITLGRVSVSTAWCQVFESELGGRPGRGPSAG
jgi:hypothetical protein